MLQCNVFPGLPPDFLDSEVNLFLMPFMDSEAESENPPRAGMVWCFLGLEADVGPPWLRNPPGVRGDSGLSPQCLGPFSGACFRVGGE